MTASQFCLSELRKSCVNWVKIGPGLCEKDFSLCLSGRETDSLRVVGAGHTKSFCDPLSSSGHGYIPNMSFAHWKAGPPKFLQKLLGEILLEFLHF